MEEDKNERPDANSSVMLKDTPSDAGHDCSASNRLESSLGGSCTFLVSVLSAPYTGEGLTLDIGHGFPQGNHNLNPSCEFTRLLMPSALVTPRTDVNVPKDSSPDHLEQHNNSSASISPISVRLPKNDLKPQGSICTMGVGMLTSRILAMWPFQDKSLDRMPRVRTLVMQPATLLVGAMHPLTFSYSEFFVYKAQIHETRINPRTSSAQKYSLRTKKYRCIRRVRISKNHHRNRNHAVEH